MKRWIALAACVLSVAACQDQTGPVGAAPEAQPARLLALNPLVTVDPTLTTLLNLAGPTEQVEVLVTYDETLTTGDAVASALTGSGAGIIRFEHLPIVYAVATPAQVAQASNQPGVISLYSNKQLQYFLAESTKAIRATDAWAAGYTGKGVGVAILDSGVDGLYHPGLAYPTKTVDNVKFIGSVRDLVTFGDGVPAVGGELFVENVPNSETSVGHGTHVAGIVAGDGGGSTNGWYKGVAPDANIIGVGAGDILFVFWILAGFDYILDKREEHNIQVVNNSWGTTGEFVAEDPINVATKQVHKAGIAVVFAAGNEGPGQNTLNPYSVAPWVISVAAGCKLGVLDPTNAQSHCLPPAGAGADWDPANNMLADFSSRGVPGDALYHPDITAPGVHIVSARAALGAVMNATDLNHDATICNISIQHVDYYTCASGTSMAAPHIAGVIALMEEAARGKLTPDQAYRALARTARPLAGYGEWEVGAGYVDAYAATRSVRR